MPNDWSREKRKAYNADWYKKNRSAQLERVKRNNERYKDEIRAAKQKPCADCGVEYPYYVMDFDHVRGVKEFGIAEKSRRGGRKALADEIAKCDVVCANCHRIRTYTRPHSSTDRAAAS
jgi:hypothetical protein